MKRRKDPAAAAPRDSTVLCRLADPSSAAAAADSAEAAASAAKAGLPLRRVDIPDGGSNGFAVHCRGELLRFMTLRRNDHVFVYVNRCPHAGLPLDFGPGQFLVPSIIIG